MVEAPPTHGEVSLCHRLNLFLNGPTPASFSFIFGLFKQTLQFLQQINVNNVKSIQYKAPGFKLMTSQS